MSDHDDGHDAPNPSSEPPPADSMPPLPENLGLNQPAASPSPAAPAKRAIPWKMIIRVAIGIAVLAAIFVPRIGRTNADDLQIGDCFAIPDDGEFRNVKDQSCDGPHEAQIFSIVPAASVETECVDTLQPLVSPAEERGVLIPPSFGVASVMIEEDPTNAFCVLVDDAGGLSGSLFSG